MGIFSFFSKEKKENLDKGLSKTKENVFSKITRAIAGKVKLMMKYWIIWKRY
jgi:fused signal recognition particle receptor